mmetsp:Transcript_12152/g.30455  ORF Transcript_12152/g.30455 Transcript_12152/m.30455 type:complete len:494 (+) Transcript_12152:283-1764(+)
MEGGAAQPARHPERPGGRSAGGRPQHRAARDPQILARRGPPQGAAGKGRQRLPHPQEQPPQRQAGRGDRGGWRHLRAEQPQAVRDSCRGGSRRQAGGCDHAAARHLQRGGADPAQHQGGPDRGRGARQGRDRDDTQGQGGAHRVPGRGRGLGGAQADAAGHGGEGRGRRPQHEQRRQVLRGDRGRERDPGPLHGHVPDGHGGLRDGRGEADDRQLVPDRERARRHRVLRQDVHQPRRLHHQAQHGLRGVAARVGRRQLCAQPDREEQQVRGALLRAVQGGLRLQQGLQRRTGGLLGAGRVDRGHHQQRDPQEPPRGHAGVGPRGPHCRVQHDPRGGGGGHRRARQRPGLLRAQRPLRVVPRGGGGDGQGEPHVHVQHDGQQQRRRRGGGRGELALLHRQRVHRKRLRRGGHEGEHAGAEPQQRHRGHRRVRGADAGLVASRDPGLADRAQRAVGYLRLRQLRPQRPQLHHLGGGPEGGAEVRHHAPRALQDDD